jgi:hypothetical protein
MEMIGMGILWMFATLQTIGTVAIAYQKPEDTRQLMLSAVLTIMLIYGLVLVSIA